MRLHIAMASIRIPSVFLIKFFVYVSLVSLSLHIPRSGLKSIHGFQGNETTETQKSNHHYHTIHASSLLPSSVCKPASLKAHNRKSSLKVIHRHGPCNGDEQKYPPLTEILRQDQIRVNAIYSKPTKKYSGHIDIEETKDTTLPAKIGYYLGTGNYVVMVGLGTPEKDLSLAFDTGSYLTWTQCEPCSNCYPQKEPIFDPTMSQTYSNIPCSSPTCNSNAGRLSCDTSSTCTYMIGYGDNSFTVGSLAMETLTLTPTDVFPNFIFGCGRQNQGLFGTSAGLLGLSRDANSLVFQTAEKYKKVFSYCLPSNPSSTGHLTFGSANGVPDSVKFIPLVSADQGSTFYGVELIGLNIGGQKLPIDDSVFSESGVIIDSGTVITRLPPAAYSALRTAFRQIMANYPAAQPPDKLLDTCYDFSGLSSYNLPTISFIFGGDVEVDIDKSGILFGESESQKCLAFAANDDPDAPAIIGNTQQRRLEVVYDVAGERIGFAPGRCD